jgi:very-short-patch-repair endonuclease
MKREYNWKSIQEYYNDNHFWNDILKEFNLSNNTLCKAVKLGYFKTRSKSETCRLYSKLNPRKHTKETKNKISIARKKYLIENPDKVPYKLNHYSKGESYPEKYFNKIFSKQPINYIKELPVKYYSLDFAFDGKINVEIDGEQHYVDERIIKSNQERDEYLQNKGWKIIRIRWAKYKKMSKKEKLRFIADLYEALKFGNGDIKISDYLTEKKYFCECGQQIRRGSTQCQKCYSIKQRKVERPSQEQLLQEIKELGYSATGRRYGVSDNAVRKWLK